MIRALKALAKIAIASLLSIVIFLFIGEIAVRLYCRNHLIYDIEMTRYSLYLKEDSGNPLIVQVHKPGSSCKLMGVNAHINSDGLRDSEHSLPKDGKYRIIFLGDSITFGWGVPEADSFKSIIERELNKSYPAEIINFGDGNYNTEQEANLFFEKGLKYNPDKVVVFYSINDAEPTPKKSPLWFLGYSRIITFYWSRLHAFLVSMDSSRQFASYYSGLYGRDQIGWLNAQKAFLQLKDVCRKNNIALQVVLLPEQHNFVNYPFKKENAIIKAFLETNDIDVYDLAPDFSWCRNPLELWVALDDGHPNSRSHKLIAQYTLDFIKERKGR